MPGSATDTQTAPPVPRHRSGSRRPRSSRPPDWSAGRSGTRSCRASCPPRPRPRRRPPGAARMGLGCRPRPSRCQVDAGHRAGVMVGDPQRPAPDGEALRAGAGPDRAVARRRPRWSRDRSQPPCCRRAPTGTCRLWSCWYAGEGDDRGEPFTDEGGHGGAGAGLGRRLGRSRGTPSVGIAGAPGCREQYPDDQRLLPASSAKRRRPKIGGGWHGAPPLPGLQSGASFLHRMPLAGSPRVEGQRGTATSRRGAATVGYLAAAPEKLTSSFGSVVATQTWLPVATTSRGRPRVR
jgi:hypothetical protein